MATAGRRHRPTRRVVAVGLLGVLAVLVAACDGGTNSAAGDRAGSNSAAASGDAAPATEPATPSSPSTPSTTPTPADPATPSDPATGAAPAAPSSTASPTGPAAPAATEPRPDTTTPTPAPSPSTSPSSPSVDAAAGPGGPGAAWRSALAADLGQWSSTPVCSSQRSAPPASASAPVQYVAITEDASGRPQAHALSVTSAADKAAQLDELARTSGTVVSFEVDTGVHEVVINDPVYLGPPSSSSGPQYWVDRVRYETAWGAGLAQGTGVRIAIVDSGVQADHPDLGRAESGGAVASGADFLSLVPGDERTDTGSHGTHVAGIAGARDNTIGGIGGAPQATIVPVRVLNGSSGSISNVAAGIMWAADPTLGNADVINLSLGSSQCSETLFDALTYAVSQQATIVAAAGNCSCTTERLYPAAFSNNLTGVIAVASTDTNNQHSSFSNVNDYLTISAPGSAIWSTIPADGYGLKNGTSMASPAVAAVVALVKAKCPGYTPAQMRTRLTSTAQALGSSTIFGAGLVRADLAVAPAC